jgi:hypothetical protein
VYLRGCAAYAPSHVCAHQTRRSQRIPRPFLRGCRIDDRCARLCVPADPFAFSFSQCCEQTKPCTFEAQASEMVEHRLPRGKVAWQVAPGAAGAQDVENRVKDGSQRVGWRSATSGRGRQMALEALPFCIGKIAWITGTHPSSLSHQISGNGQKPLSRRFLRFAKHALRSLSSEPRLA